MGEQPTFAKQMKLHNENANKNLRENHKESQLPSNYEPQAIKKFFDPAIFQKCWRGSGRVALIAARRQRNPCAMLLAHGGGGEKSDSFSRRGEQGRSAL